jgi:predicted ATPase
VASLSFRSVILWLLGYPEAALVDGSQALEQAREMGSAGTSMTALAFVPLVHIECGNYSAANEEARDLADLANEKDASLWKAVAVLLQGCVFSSTGEASKAVQIIISGIAALRATGAMIWMPMYLTYLAKAYANLNELSDAQRFIGEAMITIETTKETWYEAEVHRAAGEIALKSPPERDTTKAQAYFDRALAVARQQQAKSWELRAAMSMARLWRDQGKRDDARELLAPVYGWFTERFDTLDLKEAKKLLDELAS